MAIIEYEDGICRDTNVHGNNVYIGNGQGCGTIWFKNVESARKSILKEDGIESGSDLFDCTKCSCHYSYRSKEYLMYPEFACKKLKEKYAKSFEVKKK